MKNKKALSSTIIFLLLGTNAWAFNYDSSTVKTSSVTVPTYSAPGAIVFPMLNAPSLREAMVEAKSFADATSRRFFYELLDEEAKRKSPFYFPGGTIYALKDTLKEFNLYADVSYSNTIKIYSKKKQTIKLQIFDTYTPLLNALKGNPYMRNVSLRGTVLTLDTYPKGEDQLGGLIHGFTVEHTLKKRTVKLPALESKNLLIQKLRAVKGIRNVKSEGNTLTFVGTSGTLAQASAVVEDFKGIHTLESRFVTIGSVESKNVLIQKLKKIKGIQSVKEQSDSVALVGTANALDQASSIAGSYAAAHTVDSYFDKIGVSKSHNELLTSLKKVKGIQNASIVHTPYLGVQYTATKDALPIAKDKIRYFNAEKTEAMGVEVASNTKDNTIRGVLEKMYPYNKISHFDGESDEISYSGAIANIDQLNEILHNEGKTISQYEFNAQDGSKKYSFTVGKYHPIILNRPYTVKTLIKELSAQSGVDYDVSFDANIPVNKNVKIEKLEDLNKYLKKTTGQSFEAKKVNKKVVISEKEGE